MIKKRKSVNGICKIDYAPAITLIFHMNDRLPYYL